MKTFRQILLESLKSPFDYKIKTSNQSIFSAEWEVPGTDDKPFAIDYVFKATNELKHFGYSWGIVFQATDDVAGSGFGIIGAGEAFRVFATVAAILKDFIKAKKPEAFHFTADEKSRIKLYNKLTKKITSSSPYELTKIKATDNLIYVLHLPEFKFNNPDRLKIMKK